MDAWITKIRKYLKHFIELGVLLIGVSVFAEILFGPDVAFFGSQVTTNLVGLLNSLGESGIAALIVVFAVIITYRKLLNLVPKDLYQKLSKIDLNKKIDIPDNTYDAVMCVGTFTYGHVKPNALDEFLRITKNKGLICFTINEGIYEEYGFDAKIKNLKKNKKWILKEFFKSDYIKSKDVNAWLGLAEVIK